jgi:hypothetical protein
MTTTTTWDTITAAVTADAERLQAMTTHADLYGWAKERGLVGIQFGAVKHELRKIGVDYNSIRDEVTRQRLADITGAIGETDLPVIALSAAGADEVGSYAVCDDEGTVVWYGTFHQRDRLYCKGNQASADTSAASKAIFVASKARQAAGIEYARLNLTLANPHVDTDYLVREATTRRLVLHLEINDDPADPHAATAWCENPGFQDWKQADLSALVEGRHDADEVQE